MFPIFTIKVCLLRNIDEKLILLPTLPFYHLVVRKFKLPYKIQLICTPFSHLIFEAKTLRKKTCLVCLTICSKTQFFHTDPLSWTVFINTYVVFYLSKAPILTCREDTANMIEISLEMLLMLSNDTICG